NPTGFAGMGGLIYFAAVGVTGNELWKSDGTAANTVHVADIAPGGTPVPNSSNPANLTALGRTLFFAANRGPTAAQLCTAAWGGGGEGRVPEDAQGGGKRVVLRGGGRHDGDGVGEGGGDGQGHRRGGRFDAGVGRHHVRLAEEHRRQAVLPPADGGTRQSDRR